MIPYFNAAETWDNSKKVQKMEATIRLASNASHFFFLRKKINTDKLKDPTEQ